jgi:hypothetical protein
VALDDPHPSRAQLTRERVEHVRVANVQAIALLDGNEDAQHSTTSKRASHDARKFTLAIENRPQQRAPRQRDTHLGDAPVQCGQRRPRVGGQEQGVGLTTLVGRPSSAPRRLAQAARISVDTDDQRLWMGPGKPGHRPTVTGAQIHDRPLVAGDQLVDLADVDFGEPTSDGDAHGAGF